jgi:serine phosphatase RsbU (regulator of sigma subunit)/ketosteroid isomerase-like protein
MSSVEENNKALVRRFLEAQAKANLNVIDEVLTHHFVDHDRLPGQAPDREGYKRAIVEYHAAFSNVRFLIEDQVAEGDKVVTRFIVRATHDVGELMGDAPTGREVTYKALAIHRIVGGKIVEEWAEGSNISAVMEQRLEQERMERERIEQELRVARRIQQASLPKETPTLAGWQVSPFYQPAREVGGDFYDFFELEDGRVGVVVGDATGKGIPAALLAEATSNMLRAVAQALDSTSPGKVLERVNETLLARIPPNMFVTCFYAILEPDSGRLTYANAGHDLPYLHRNGEAEELRARGMPLGLMPGRGYEEKKTILEAGERALFYSDGLVEAHDPKGEMFGFPRLRALIAEHPAEERSLGNFLMEGLHSFVGEGWEQEDDITLLTLKREH